MPTKTPSLPVSQTPLPEGSPFVKVTRTVNRNIDLVFPETVNADLTRIFPETTKTTVPDHWGKEGQERENTSKDGSTRREQLTLVEAPMQFRYRVHDFTTPELKENLDHIEGGWVFTDNGNDTTSIEWVYVLVPRTSDKRSVIEKKLVPGYRSRLEKALDIIKTDLEAKGTTR